MPKYVAPKGTQGIHIGGAYFAADKDGLIDLPEDGNYTSLLPAEYTPYKAPATDGTFPASEQPAEQAKVVEQATEDQAEGKKAPGKK